MPLNWHEITSIRDIYYLFRLNCEFFVHLDCSKLKVCSRTLCLVVNIWVIPSISSHLVAPGDPLRFCLNSAKMIPYGQNEHSQKSKFILHTVFEKRPLEVCPDPPSFAAHGPQKRVNVFFSNFRRA